jgi:3,4-dihydroxy 2-butanone 4-phosphate synthase/GTP cyclohydrolase II
VQTLDPVADPFALRPDVRATLRAMDEAGVGVFLYVYNREKVSLERSFVRQVLGQTPSVASDGGLSEVFRDFGLGAQVLADLGCQKIRLMSNSSRKIVGIEGYGIDIVERVPVPSDDGGKVLQIRKGHS